MRGLITSNTNNITTNTNNISSLNNRVTTLENSGGGGGGGSSSYDDTEIRGLITGNTNNINTLQSDLTTNTNNINSLDTRITTNEADITTNTNNINSLDTRVTTNEDDILNSKHKEFFGFSEMDFQGNEILTTGDAIRPLGDRRKTTTDNTFHWTYNEVFKQGEWSMNDVNGVGLYKVSFNFLIIKMSNSHHSFVAGIFRDTEDAKEMFRQVNKDFRGTIIDGQQVIFSSNAWNGANGTSVQGERYLYINLNDIILINASSSSTNEFQNTDGITGNVTFEYLGNQQFTTTTF